MRNRVAGRKTRSLVTVRLAGLVALLMIVPAQLAFAQDGTAPSMPASFAGPVGIAVAGLGLSGVVLGLWRFRRKLIRDRAVATEVTAVVEAAAEPRTPAPAP